MTNVIKPATAFVVPVYTYASQFLRSKDGDTLVFMTDQGFGNFIQLTARLYGVNTPEIHGVAKTSPEYIAGKAAEDFVINWMEEAKRQVVLVSFDGKKVQTEKYGRWLVLVYRENDLVSLNEALLSKGLAKPTSF